MPLLSYQISSITGPNNVSTTGALDGHISAILKTDHEEAVAQVYSEIVANRLALFLGIPVAIGVPAKLDHEENQIRFASLRASESDQTFYDFTEFDTAKDANHKVELKKLTAHYPEKISEIAVFDYWIGNQDRELNFKAELSKTDRGIIFVVDHGNSLLSCNGSITNSINSLANSNFPSFHFFDCYINKHYANIMIEKITQIPDWALENAVVINDVVGSVTVADQYALYEALITRKSFLQAQIDRLKV